MRKATLLALSLLFLTGCRGVYGEADDQILCHRTEPKAFLVKRGFGQASFVERFPAADDICKK